MTISVLLTIYLGIAHWLADFFLQTDWMAVNKSRRWDVLLLHVVVYSTAMSILMWSWQFGIVTFALHFLTDAATSRMGRALFPWTPRAYDNPKLYLDEEGEPSGPWGLGLKRSRHWFFTVIGADQWLFHWPQLVLTAVWLEI